MKLTKAELEYLKGVRAQIAALSAEQDRLFNIAQKILSPHFDKQWAEDYLFDYLVNGGELPKDL